MLTDKPTIPDHLLEAARQQTSPLSQHDVETLLIRNVTSPPSSGRLPMIAGSAALVAVGAAATIWVSLHGPDPVQVNAAPELPSSPMLGTTEPIHHAQGPAPELAVVSQYTERTSTQAPPPAFQQLTTSVAPTLFLTIEQGRIVHHARDRYSTRQALASPDARVECLSNGLRVVHSGQPITLSLSPGSPCPVFVTSRRGVGHAVLTGGLATSSVEDVNELIPMEADEDLVLWFKNDPEVLDLAPDSLRTAMIGLVTLRHEVVNSHDNTNPEVETEATEEYSPKNLSSTIVVARSSGLAKNVLAQLSRFDGSHDGTPAVRTDTLGDSPWTNNSVVNERWTKNVVRFESIDRRNNVLSDTRSSQSSIADSSNNSVHEFSIGVLSDSLIGRAIRRLQSSCRKPDDIVDSIITDEGNTSVLMHSINIDLAHIDSVPWQSTFMDDSLWSFSKNPFRGLGRDRQHYFDSLLKSTRANFDSMLRNDWPLNINELRDGSIWIDSIMSHDPSKKVPHLDTRTRLIDIDMNDVMQDVNDQIHADSNVMQIRSRFKGQDTTIGSSRTTSRQQSIVIVLKCADGSKRTIQPQGSTNLPLQESSRSSQGAVASTSVYPNPATDGGATLSYILTEDRTISVHLHDLSGTPVQTLVDPIRRLAGRGQLAFTWSTLPKGIYLVVLSTDRGEQAVQRLIIQ